MNIPKWLDFSEEQITAHDESARLYRYTYGIKDIQVKSNEFEKASVFVSRPYEVDGNVMEVSLEADERNYATYSSGNGTSPFDTTIEYYISFREHPRYDEWIPILPTGRDYIYEYLFTKGTKQGRLRFACDPSREISVYKNGIKLPEDSWSFCPDNSIAVDKRYDKYAIYTVGYHPNVIQSDPWNINLKEDDREIIPFIGPDGSEGEVFRNGSDRNGTITLCKHPYVDYKRINTEETGYHPVEVFLENARIAGPNRTVYTSVGPSTVPATRNVTDYKTLTDSFLCPYDPSPVIGGISHPYFEYIQDGRKLYFTETFNNSGIVSNMPTNHGDAWVRVKYEYLRSKLRFKSILRNVSPETPSVTPSVNGYSLIFKVMR